MKSSYIAIVSIFGILSACIAADTEWNKEIQVESPVPGGTPTTAILNFSGIGAIINKKDGKCIIMMFFNGSGAEEAGLKVSDVITHVDAKDISDLDLHQISALLRGNPDTTVVITIERAGEGKPEDVTVTRHPVNLRNNG